MDININSMSKEKTCKLVFYCCENNPLWPKWLIEESIQLCLLLRRFGGHDGRAKAWWQEHLRIHILICRQETEDTLLMTYGLWSIRAHCPQKLTSLSVTTPPNPSYIVLQNGDQVLKLMSYGNHFHSNHCKVYETGKLKKRLMQEHFKIIF